MKNCKAAADWVSGWRLGESLLCICMDEEWTARQHLWITSQEVPI